jgi:tetratricopeptide (TPR) repeat protein
MLQFHQRNASYYFERGLLSQAMGQIDKGLELDPDDYKLNSLKGAVMLKTSANSQGTDHKQLDQATELLARIFEFRSASRHEPYLLFNYALALQKQGRRHLGEAVRLEGQASRASEPEAMLESAKTERQLANENLAQARELLDVLIERGFLLRYAYNHKLQIAQDLGDDKAFQEAGKAYLEQVAKDQQLERATVDGTMAANHEAERFKALRDLLAEEVDVRILLAEHYHLQAAKTSGEQATKHREEELANLNKILELNPQRSADYYNRGCVLLELNQPEAAKADFRRFLATTTLPASSDKKTVALKALGQ